MFNKVTLYGLLIFFSGCAVLGYQGICKIMERHDCSGTLILENIESVTPEIIEKFPQFLHFLFTTPLWILLASVGGVVLIIGGVFIKN